MVDVEQIQVGKLYDDLLSNGAVPYVHGDGYEVIDCNGIEIASSTVDGAKTKYVKLLKLSRHKTIKNLIKISVKAETGEKTDVTVTTDHVCMRYDRDRVLENVKAKDLRTGDYVSLFSGALGWIDKIEDLGPTADYVYDCEVDDDLHAFYANDILVHNSQFIDLYPVTNSLIKKYCLPEKIAEWPQEKRQELWDIVSKFTDTEINAFVRKAVHENFHTNMQDRLTYELEYMVDVGIYESQKHYFVHKIFEEGDAVDKIKVTGISLKKNETDKSMKNYLKDIYEGVVVHDWTEKDYENYVNKLYDEFKTFSIDQISFWKGYGTECGAVGFMQMAKGATQISRACTYYNQLIEKMGLGKKYDQLRVGDKCRFTYLKPGNKYGINCIAYKPGQWPKEFDGIFEVDYSVMFDKIIRDQLKRFREACNFEDCDPRKQVVQDVFEL